MDEKMGASEPADVDRLFMEAWNCNDLDGMVALFEPEGILIPQAGERVTGRDAIRQVFAGFVAAFPKIDLTTRGVVEQGGLALVYSDFVLRGTGEGGEPTTLEGHPTVVLRRQTCGTWLFVIDDPFSTA
jgi:uncharacterized protein (TIGR02246 family)